MSIHESVGYKHAICKLKVLKKVQLVPSVHVSKNGSRLKIGNITMFRLRSTDYFAKLKKKKRFCAIN